ncbi:UDP-glycosyltransferase [Flavobacterium sp.]|uniref:UDP-glycosyltransferase n=1 Tax=Flavobacterium sp. TaxID=239 RepID=UPI0025F49B02|nr:UDP-glycosyltransferase [Flavobacterium sp.]
MKNKKIFILLPDGIGLKNFAFTNFHKLGLKKGFDIIFWNNTLFELTNLGIKEIKIEKAKAHPTTDLYKIAQTHIELSQNIRKSNDTIYNSYRFPLSFKDLKSCIKSIIIKTIIFCNNSENGLKRIRKKIVKNERKTKLYFDSYQTLKKEKPAIVFSTNQRPMLAVGPILAAQDLGIPTATFIFSWDNLPKGTKILETDFYCVWSEHMKKELQYYYPYINENQIFITGTPQFEPHFVKNNIVSKEVFYNQNKLDFSKKYICFSGDDATTSPNDPQYLLDIALAVISLNLKGYNLGIIFRRCPVDFSKRYDEVLEKHKNLITSLDPNWEIVGKTWNAILPTKKDLILQINTIYHTELVINLGSSMVFDYVALNKPCGYINYDVSNNLFPHWNVKNIYNFIHFKSMPVKESVFWLNHKDDIAPIIEKMLHPDSNKIVKNAKNWFENINQHPAENASQRIWSTIEMIIKDKNAVRDDILN